MHQVRNEANYTARKASRYEVISGPYFPLFRPEITPYLGTFHPL